MREAGLSANSTVDDWDDYQAYELKAEQGTVSSRIFRSDTSIYFDIGS
jgi:hypothetical protein